ncbi:hypothetical protein [Acetobacter senegalensis]|uniref:hypothetical protein n=1 Tax=Acetobacter senegalensis TaxID=446692 RepID=UPI001EDB9F3F|nr:hypothetical protein [Acetobacter senegalensis]MCG4273081.1 hypothetical protein [Acetobacter senegalensis]
MPKRTPSGAPRRSPSRQRQFKLPVDLPEQKPASSSTEPRSHRKNSTQQTKVPAQDTPTPPASPQTDLFSYPFPPPPAPPRTHFTAEELRLSYSPPQSFTPRTAPDSWLYFVTDREEAHHLLHSGLHLTRKAPLLLTERNGVCAWLEKMAEDPAGPAAFPCVLRLRRTMVADMLEPDPDHSAEFSAECYLLSGATHEQDR